MIAFVQPFGLLDAGGGSRILRALLEEAPEPYISVCTHPRGARELAGEEVHLPYRPYFGRVERSRLNKYIYPLISCFDDQFSVRFERRLETLFRERGVTAVHAIPHAVDFWWTFRVAQRMNVPYYLNVHDDLAYNLHDKTKLDRVQEWFGHVWVHADGRMVISDVMGEEYARRYGDLDYEVITDGLQDPVRTQPRVRDSGCCRLYFLGAMHLTYHPNVEAMEEALVRLQEREGMEAVSMVLRGSAMPVKRPRIPVDERPFAPEDVVERDFDDVDILYFPLPFGEQYAPFRRFSMSTKLVTYLGTGLPILYHGPNDAAASCLLARHDAAVQVHSLDPDVLLQGIAEAARRSNELSTNALRLGRERFRLDDQRERFWKVITWHQTQVIQ